MKILILAFFIFSCSSVNKTKKETINFSEKVKGGNHHLFVESDKGIDSDTLVKSATLYSFVNCQKSVGKRPQLLELQRTPANNKVKMIYRCDLTEKKNIEIHDNIVKHTCREDDIHPSVFKQCKEALPLILVN